MELKVDYNKVGTLHFTKETVDVTDPCYDKDVLCRSTITNVKPDDLDTEVYLKEEQKKIPVVLILDEGDGYFDWNVVSNKQHRGFHLTTEEFYNKMGGFYCDNSTTITNEILAIPIINKNDKTKRNLLKHDEDCMELLDSSFYCLPDNNGGYVNSVPDIVSILNGNFKLLEIVAVEGCDYNIIRKSDDHYLTASNPDWDEESFDELLEEIDDEE